MIVMVAKQPVMFSDFRCLISHITHPGRREGKPKRRQRWMRNAWWLMNVLEGGERRRRDTLVAAKGGGGRGESSTRNVRPWGSQLLCFSTLPTLSTSVSGIINFKSSFGNYHDHCILLSSIGLCTIPLPNRIRHRTQRA